MSDHDIVTYAIRDRSEPVFALGADELIRRGYVTVTRDAYRDLYYVDFNAPFYKATITINWAAVMQRQQQSIMQYALGQQGLQQSQQQQGMGINQFGSQGFGGMQQPALGQQVSPGYLNGLYNALMGGGQLTRKATPPPSKLWENPERVTTEILGFRFWDLWWEVAADGVARPILRSPFQGVMWEGPTLTGQAPAANEAGGIFALGTESRQEAMWRHYLIHDPGFSVKRRPVWGVVVLSGLVAEGENGYRAEQATVHELWVYLRDLADGTVMVDPEVVARLLADRYQCDVGVRAPTWEFARDYMKAREAQNAAPVEEAVRGRGEDG